MMLTKNVNRMTVGVGYWRMALVVLLVCVSLTGCSGSAQQDPVRPGAAMETLITTLMSWKEGKLPESLKTAVPEVVVQDPDWSAGARLSSFELTSDGEAVGSNLSVQVRLELTGVDGTTETKDVWYLVGTDPVLTVFRDLLHP